MERRNTPPYDYEADDRSRYLRVAGGILIGLLVAYTLAVTVGALANAGAVTRPYADLPAVQLPDITTIDIGDGTARLAGTIPAGAGPWHAATFHVPDPGRWHDDQVLVDTIGVPAGTFDVTLRCEPGAAQVDFWLDGQTEPYAAATTLECGGAEPAASPALPAAQDVSAAQVPSPAVDTSSEGKPETSSHPPGSVTASPAAPQPTVAVAGVYRTLPATGRGWLVALAVTGAWLTLSGLLALSFGRIRKDSRP